MADRHTKIKGKQIQTDTVEPSDLMSTNSASDGLVPAYDLATGQFIWKLKTELVYVSEYKAFEVL